MGIEPTTAGLGSDLVEPRKTSEKPGILRSLPLWGTFSNRVQTVVKTYKLWRYFGGTQRTAGTETVRRKPRLAIVGKNDGPGSCGDWRCVCSRVGIGVMAWSQVRPRNPWA